MFCSLFVDIRPFLWNGNSIFINIVLWFGHWYDVWISYESGFNRVCRSSILNGLHGYPSSTNFKTSPRNYEPQSFISYLYTHKFTSQQFYKKLVINKNWPPQGLMVSQWYEITHFILTTYFSYITIMLLNDWLSQWNQILKFVCT